MPDKIAICWVDPGHVAGRFSASILFLIYREQRIADLAHENSRYAGHLRLESGPRIAASRNALVRSFLASENLSSVDWLLMLDSDMTFNEDLFDKLLEGAYDDEGNLAKPLIGGLCFGGGHGSIFPTLYRMVDPKTNNGNAVGIVHDFVRGESVKVDATGAACLLMHRSVLEKMAAAFPEPTPWFAEGQHKPEGAEVAQEFGEDWTFCMRAQRLGYPIYVNTDAQIGHLKTVEMNEWMWRTGDSGLKSLELRVPIQVNRETMGDEPHLNRQQRRRAERAGHL